MNYLFCFLIFVTVPLCLFYQLQPPWHSEVVDSRVDEFQTFIEALAAAKSRFETAETNLLSHTSGLSAATANLKMLASDLHDTTTTLGAHADNFGRYYWNLSTNNNANSLALPCWSDVVTRWNLKRYYDVLLERHFQSVLGVYAMKELASDYDSTSTTASDEWYWTDDNAKAMELFALPGALDAYQHHARKAYDFVMHMSHRGLIFRRMAVDRLVVVRDDVTNIHVRNSLLRVTGNLESGFLKFSHRLHDVQEEVAFQVQVRLGGHSALSPDCVLFLSGSRSLTSLSTDSASIVMIHSSDVYSLCNPRLVVGRLQFKTVLGNGCNYFNHTCLYVPISESLVDTRGVRCVINFHENNFVKYAKAIIAMRTNDESTSSTNSNGNNNNKIVYENVKNISFGVRSRFAWAMFAQGNIAAAGFAFAIVPNMRGSTYEIKSIDRSLDIGCDDCSGPLTFSTFLVAGGLYGMLEIYQSIVDHLYDGTLLNLDLSVSSDYGVEMNGVASLFASEAWGCNKVTTIPPIFFTERTLLWFNTTLYAFGKGLITNGFYKRGMAFAILALDTMYSVTHYSYYLQTQMQFVAFLRRTVSATEQIDDLAAVCLALCRSAITFRNFGLAYQALGLLNLLEIRPNSNRNNAVMMTLKQDGTTTTSAATTQSTTTSSASPSCNPPFCFPRHIREFLAFRNRDSIYLTYKAGLVCRAARLLLYMHTAKMIVIPPSHLEKLLSLQNISLNYMSIVTRASSSHNEILTSWQSTETNSETQPWCVLGAAGIDIFYITRGRGHPPPFSRF
jgi:hypothetical protein